MEVASLFQRTRNLPVPTARGARYRACFRSLSSDPTVSPVLSLRIREFAAETCPPKAAPSDVHDLWQVIRSWPAPVLWPSEGARRSDAETRPIGDARSARRLVEKGRPGCLPALAPARSRCRVEPGEAASRTQRVASSIGPLHTPLRVVRSSELEPDRAKCLDRLDLRVHAHAGCRCRRD